MAAGCLLPSAQRRLGAAVRAWTRGIFLRGIFLQGISALQLKGRVSGGIRRASDLPSLYFFEG